MAETFSKVFERFLALVFASRVYSYSKGGSVWCL